LRRFIAVPDIEALKEAEKTGGVIVCEGVPKNSKMMASTGLFPQSAPGTHIISDYDMHASYYFLLAFRRKIADVLEYD
jgi:hypothetical protein